MKKIDKGFYLLTVTVIGVYAVSVLITGNGIPCYIKELTHFYCPGCGITRMFISLFKLEFYQAFRYNPLIFILLFLTLLFFMVNFIYHKRYNKKIKITNTVYLILLIVIVTFGVMRNIPFFSFLAPTVVN